MWWQKVESNRMLNGSGVLEKIITAYQIVHSLPGRLRIHIPMLEKLPRRWYSYSDRTADLIMMQKGITGVNIEPVTGNVLIRYNPQQIGESDILTWLKTLVETFITSKTPSTLRSDADVHIRFDYLKEWILQNRAFD